MVRRLNDGWARYVGGLGREQLTVFAVEDVHWASSALLDLLEQLADNLADTRVLLVCTARLELLENRPTWGAGKQNASALTLAPLSAGEATELISSLLGEGQVPPDVRERVLASAEGNPFYLEEMLTMLIEEGALERQNGGWSSTARLADVSIPDSVHGVIAARIDLLDEDAREGLRRCSVVGRVFWPSAVGVDEDVIASLVRSGLVTDRLDSVVAGMREFSFKHALTRDVAYASLPRPERRELHRRVGEWVQEVAPDRSGETVELAAYHFGQALAYGEDDPAVSKRAFELLYAASVSAYGRGAFAAARTRLENASELAVDGPDRALVEIALARLDMTEAALERVFEHLDAAEARLGPDDAQLRSDALGVRSRVSWLSGRWDEALRSATEAVSALEGLPESPQLARALARLSQIQMLKQQPLSIGTAERAIDVARRVGDPFAEVNARINIFTQRSAAGVAPDPDDVLSIIDSAVEAGEYEEGYRAIVNLIWSSTGYLHVERIEELVAEARARLADVPAPRSIGPYLDVSVVMALLVPDRTLGRSRHRARPAARLRAEHGDATGLPGCGRRARGAPRPGGRRIPGRAAPARSGERRAPADHSDGVRGRALARGDGRSQGASLPDGRGPRGARRRLAEHARQRSDRARTGRGRRDRPARADDRVDAQVERGRREDADLPARRRRAARARRRPRGGRGPAPDSGRRARAGASASPTTRRASSSTWRARSKRPATRRPRTRRGRAPTRSFSRSASSTRSSCCCSTSATA